MAISVASVLFALARLLLPAFYRLPFLPFVLRPFTGHFLRGPWTFSLLLHHFGLLSRAWFLGFTTFISWEIAECLFEKIVAEITPLSTLSPDHNTTLVSGVASSNSFSPMLNSGISLKTRLQRLKPVEQLYLAIKNILQIFGLFLLGKASSF
jgi:hypothetical protein